MAGSDVAVKHGRGATICGTAVGGFCGIAQLSAVANGEHNPRVDLAWAGGLSGCAFGAMGEACASLFKLSGAACVLLSSCA